MKKLLLGSWLFLILSGVGIIFYHSEWKYSLPTPLPLQYHDVNRGDDVNIAEYLPFKNNKPVFLHFFNPSCPCSRFNIPHFRSLVKKYGEKINFMVVVLSKDKNCSAEGIKDKFNLDIPFVINPSIADSCGVYSTPQAVILNPDHKLYYRGNYNRSRYCTNPLTNYAQIALDSLIQNNPNPQFSQYAVKAYGCQLPQCCSYEE